MLVGFNIYNSLAVRDWIRFFASAEITSLKSVYELACFIVGT